MKLRLKAKPKLEEKSTPTPQKHILPTLQWCHNPIHLFQVQLNIPTMLLTSTCLTFKNVMAGILKVSEFREKKSIHSSNALVAYFKVFSR